MTWNRASVALPLIPAFLAFALRLHGLSEKPLWLDEITTHTRANLPISELIANSFAYKHFPTYFLLVRAFDTPIIDEWMLRLPSVIFGGIAILLVALIATDAWSPRAGVVAGTLMAVSPFDVQFGQEARPYTLFSCLVLLALWGLVRIAQGRQKGVFISWAAYTIGTIGALNVLLEGFFWLVASNLAMVAVVRVSAIGSTALIRNWITIQAIIVLTWLPGLIAMYLANQGDPLGGYRWVPPSTLHHVWSVISAVYLFRASEITTFELLPTRVPGFGAATVALALFGAWRLRADPKLLTVIGLAVMTMPIVILVISIFQAFWVPRYLLWSTGPFFAMVGIGAAALPRRLFPLAAVALLVGGIVNLAPYYRYETKPRWDLAAAYLAANARPGDSIVTNSTSAEYVLRVYGDRYYLNQPILNASEIANVATRFQEARNVWVMYGRTGQGNMAPEAEYLKKWSALGAPISTIKFGRHIVAFRFEPSTTRSNMGRKSPPANN